MMILISIAIGILFALLLVLHPPHWLFRVLLRFFPGATYFVDTNRRAIALTIDDGPDAATTEKILDVLERYGAKATFFIITDRIPGNEATLRRMLATGQEIGNHMTADRHSIYLPIQEFEQDLLAAEQKLIEFARPHWMRPAGGCYNQPMVAVAHQHHYQVALGSIFPWDTSISAPWFASWFILANVRPGSIVVLHDSGHWGQNTVKTLEVVLPKLNRQGYKVLGLSALTGQRNSPSVCTVGMDSCA
jgi:peptidoglycan-N-acetylglucosamine deacetylase